MIVGIAFTLYCFTVLSPAVSDGRDGSGRGSDGGLGPGERRHRRLQANLQPRGTRKQLFDLHNDNAVLVQTHFQLLNLIL